MKRLFAVVVLLGLLSTSAYATPQNFSGMETGDSAEAQSTTGTASVSTTTVRTGTYALRINPATTGTGNYRFAKMSTAGLSTTSFGTANLFSDFYFRYATKPAANDEEMYVVLDTGGTAKAFLRLNSAGNIVVYDNAVTAQCTGTTTLSSGTWYEIQFKTTTSASASAYSLAVNGVDQGCSATMTQGSTNHGSVRLGKGTNRNGQSIDFFYDDWAADDTAFTGAHKVLRMLPNGDGSTHQWTSGTNLSDWNEVKEAVTDGDTTRVKSNGSASQVNLVALQDSATVGISGSIYGVKCWSNHREDAAFTSALRVRMRSGSTNSDTSAEDAGTSYVNRFKLNTVDPADSASWTTTDLDGLECGVLDDNAGADDESTASAFVLFDDSAVATNTPTPTPTNTPTNTPTPTPTNTPTPASLRLLSSTGVGQ